MRQVYVALAILLPILILASLATLSTAIIHSHPLGDPQPPQPHANPNPAGDEGPPTPKSVTPLGDESPPSPK